jgi:hypothetical protein
MTSRRGTLVEDGARELLQFHGYTVRVIPSWFNKRFPPAHLVAERASQETRYIRIRKISHRAPTVETIELKCGKDLSQFRKHLSRHAGETGPRYEIWIYTLGHGFRCFEVLIDSIREIPKLRLVNPVVRTVKGAA